jgi:hypothetical protein
VEKGCCFAGQIALFRKMAAVPEGPTCRRLQQPDRSAKVQLLYKNINPSTTGGMIAGS